MSIVKFPNNETLPQLLLCVICGRQISPSAATAGLFDANNTQQFACNGHFWNRRQYITGWADFVSKERLKLKSFGGNNLHTEGEHVWAFH